MTKESLDLVRSFVLEGLGSGHLARGQKLPAERELALRLGTSRAAVRQALMILEAELQVTRHVGRGTFIAETASIAPPSDEERGPGDVSASIGVRHIETSPGRLLEARRLFEPAIVELVVMNATTADLKRLRRIVGGQEARGRAGEFEEGDIEFHQALARATHNDIVAATARTINDARRSPQWQTLKRIVARRNGGFRAEAIVEHFAVLEALEGRDAAEAARRMRLHLDNVRLSLFGG